MELSDGDQSCLVTVSAGGALGTHRVVRHRSGAVGRRSGTVRHAASVVGRRARSVGGRGIGCARRSRAGGPCGVGHGAAGRWGGRGSHVASSARGASIAGGARVATGANAARRLGGGASDSAISVACCRIGLSVGKANGADDGCSRSGGGKKGLNVHGLAPLKKEKQITGGTR